MKKRALAAVIISLAAVVPISWWAASSAATSASSSEVPSDMPSKMELAAPAVINAIANATGRRIYELPANLERVLLGRKLTGRAGRESEAKQFTNVSCKTRPPSKKSRN